MEFLGSYHDSLPFAFMATIVLKPTSKFWFAAFRDATGRQRRQSTGTTDKARAKRIAEQFEAAAKKKGSPQKVRENFAALYKEFYGVELPNATVRSFTTRWLKDKEPETAPATYAVYENTVGQFLKFLGGDADGDLAAISKNRIADFRNSLSDRLAQNTTNRALKIVRMIFRKARLDGYLTEDPAEGVATLRRKGQNRSRRAFSIPELQAILEVADPEWQSLIRFGLYTGQRLVDLATLTWDQIDTAKGVIRIVPRKTGKPLPPLPISEPLSDHIVTLGGTDKPGAPVHAKAFATVNEQEGRTGTLSRQFSEIMAQAGLRSEVSHASKKKGRSAKRTGSDTSFHSIRHTAVSLLKDAGIPDSVVMELVGHQSAAMSHHYTHVGREALARAANALPKI